MFRVTVESIDGSMREYAGISALDFDSLRYNTLYDFVGQNQRLYR